MFYIVGNPLSDEILNNSIDIQACMLRILSRHHITMFEIISIEYMSILEGISFIYIMHYPAFDSLYQTINFRDIRLL